MCWAFLKQFLLPFLKTECLERSIFSCAEKLTVFTEIQAAFYLSANIEVR